MPRGRVSRGWQANLFWRCLAVGLSALPTKAGPSSGNVGFLTEHDMLTEREVWTRVHQADPLRGEYGFLTQFDGITEAQARARVRQMVETFGILEFQLYNAFEGYSRPPDQSKEQWVCAEFHRPVRRSIIRAYTDEIAHLGGRSWLNIQAMATDPNDKTLQAYAHVLGLHTIDGRTLMNVVALSAAWAGAITPQWADFATSLGCSGIHWDTLGDYGHKGNEAGIDVPGFLRGALPVLRRKLLAQTCNFVDGFGWDQALMEGVGWVGNVVAFPYWEVWTVPTIEDLFFKEVSPGPHGGGVFVCFPGKDNKHKGESQNAQATGIWPVDLFIGRWQKARCVGNTHLVIGDGNRHAQTKYLTDSAVISQADIEKIRRSVFTENRACKRYPGAVPAQTFVNVAKSSEVTVSSAASPILTASASTGGQTWSSTAGILAMVAAFLAVIFLSITAYFKNRAGDVRTQTPVNNALLSPTATTGNSLLWERSSEAQDREMSKEPQWLQPQQTHFPGNRLALEGLAEEEDLEGSERKESARRFVYDGADGEENSICSADPLAVDPQFHVDPQFCDQASNVDVASNAGMVAASNVDVASNAGMSINGDDRGGDNGNNLTPSLSNYSESDVRAWDWLAASG